MALPEFARLPSGWIENGGLHSFRWDSTGTGSDKAAALMALAVIAHHASPDEGVARVTYDVLCNACGVSRAKLAAALGVLEGSGIVQRLGRSSFKLAGYDPHRGWAKLPAKRLYMDGRIAAFDNFTLRNPIQLNALKLYFLFAARRGRDTNMANISFDKITFYTGIDRARIKPAISFLASIPLVYVEHVRSWSNPYGIANAYRLVGLDSYVHLGTRSQTDEADFDPDFPSTSDTAPWGRVTRSSL